MQTPTYLDMVYVVRRLNNILIIGETPIYFADPFICVGNEQHVKTVAFLELFLGRQLRNLT